jgi:prepilin-type N-terminal cleavage/methylation domain-containing protein
LIGERTVRLSNPRNDRAFSLIELVIVVVIIGIIAAIAIPRLSRGVDGAAEAAIQGDLAVVRRSIDLYITEHHGDGPTNFVSQMTEYSDLNGNTSAVQVGAFIYGPYLRAVPKNPYNGDDTVMPATQAEAAARMILAGGAGWSLYDGGGGGDPIFYANTAIGAENSF